MKSWCKVASNLDSHPKIRRAGRCGREVFLFALRRNAEPDNPVPGRLPAVMLEPWYLADQLMMSEEDAVTGVTACRHAGLLVQDGESWVISGWEGDWGKKPVEGSERTAKWRKKQESKTSVTDETSHNVTESHRDESDVLDQRRLDKKKREKKPPVPPASTEPLKLQPQEPKRPTKMGRAIDAWTSYFSDTHNGSKPTLTDKSIGQIHTLLNKQGIDEFIGRITFLREPKPAGFWPPLPWSLDTFVARFDECAATTTESTNPAHSRNLGNR